MAEMTPGARAAIDRACAAAQAGDAQSAADEAARAYDAATPEHRALIDQRVAELERRRDR